MTCRCLPDNPIFRSDAERRVWTKLRENLRDDDVLLHGLRFSDGDGDAEVDLIVLMPEGFATIEVKGGRVWRENAQWIQLTSDGPRVTDLEHQAVGNRHRVGRYLSARWSHGRPRMQHLVALPDCTLDGADPSPGLPRRLILDSRDMPDAAGRVFDSLTIRMHNQPKRAPGAALVAEATELLAGRGDPQRTIANRVSAVEDEVRRLTREQYVILTAASQLNRVEIVGGPGTGKTWLAVEQARRWCDRGMQVGLVCFSRGLAAAISRLVGEWPKRSRKRLWVGTFHSLGTKWGVSVPSDMADDPEFWEHRFPEQMCALPVDLTREFDALVVDEAQDFADSWWPALLRGLRDPDDGNIMIFSDERQNVFGREGPELDGLIPLTLNRNMRNSKQIARAFMPLAGGRMTLLGVDGPEVRFIPCATEDAVGVADDAAMTLLDEGWRPRDVALLTTFHRHPVHRELVDAHQLDGYWDHLWTGDDIFYGTVAGFKGLERPAVVLSVDGFRSPDTAKHILYTGLSRARDQLVVCGAPALLEEVGGRELVKRLQRGTD